MDYSSIVSSALLYSDRSTDPEMVAIVDNLLKIVEAKVNRTLLTMDGSIRTQVTITDPDQIEYNLPSGFASFRSIKIVSGDKHITLDYVTPEVMNAIVTNNIAGNWYTIEAGKIHVKSHFRVAGNVLNYVNYEDVPPLTSVNTTNWLSTKYPDCYVYGLAAELCLSAKDFTAYDRYVTMFNDIMQSIDIHDDQLTWSGHQLTIRVG